MKVTSFGLSETGLVRDNNEDVWGGIIDDHFFVLADGMGGHRAGEVAAREAVNILCRYVNRSFQESGTKINVDRMKKILTQAIKDVNTEIFTMGTASEEFRGMGTTICCLYLHESGAVIGHVGDSRIYRFRNHELHMLTQDHSLISELVSTGRIEEEEAEDSKYRSIITKAIGTAPMIDPEVKRLDLREGDLFLVCSDGLTDVHSAEEIQKIIEDNSNIQNCAEALVVSSLERGGMDNITVLLVKVESL